MQKSVHERKLRVFGFGEAPAAAKLGYTIREVVDGTEEEIKARFSGDLIAVKGASIFGRDGSNEWAIMAPSDRKVHKTQWSSVRAPITDDERNRLMADLTHLRAAADRKGSTLDAWEERREKNLGKAHFELGCWLYYYRNRVGLRNGLADRIDCARRIFVEGINNPGYDFFTAFDFGERQFDTIFEMGDSEQVIDGLRQHLKDDSSGNLAAAFQNFGWPMRTTEAREDPRRGASLG